ncbi:MAG: hypothetical protein VX536_04165, partial [Pseudomonadota bacterium]|nr:hypothetical protein [Pseudomonadota bacterium]
GSAGSVGPSESDCYGTDVCRALVGHLMIPLKGTRRQRQKNPIEAALAACIKPPCSEYLGKSRGAGS